MNIADLISRLNKLDISVIFDGLEEPKGWVLCTMKTEGVCWSMEAGPDVSYAFMKTLEKCKHPQIGKILGVLNNDSGRTN